MRSKAYQAFETKLHYFDDDIELIDVLRSAVLAGSLTDASSRYVLGQVDSVRHSHLSRRQNSDVSRRHIINHLRASVYSSYVKDVYEEVTHYFKSILEKASIAGFSPGRIVGDHPFKSDANTILALGSWEKVCEMISKSIFQALENERSTLKLIEKMATKLGLNVQQSTIAAAVPYLEVRHFLVHADGLTSDEFRAAHQHIRCQDGYVVLDYSFVRDFQGAIKGLVWEFDQKVVASSLLRPEDIQ